MVSKLPPIALFAYKRPEHTECTIRSLLRCKGVESFEIHVFADGGKSAADKHDVENTRAIMRTLLGDRATFHYREENFGLARSIIAGVTELVTSSGSVIVVEDDLELHPQFLEFMRRAIEAYRAHESVMQVSGFLLPAPGWTGSSACNFLPFTTSWGWATWDRAWSKFDAEAAGREILQTDSATRKQFNLNNTLDYAGMLQSQMDGEIDSWAIRWYWTVFKFKGLVAYPPISLVTNNGFDGSGTHGQRLAKKITKPTDQNVDLVFNFSDTPKVSMQLYEAVTRQLAKQTIFFESVLLRVFYRWFRSARATLLSIQARLR